MPLVLRVLIYLPVLSDTLPKTDIKPSKGKKKVKAIFCYLFKDPNFSREGKL